MRSTVSARGFAAGLGSFASSFSAASPGLRARPGAAGSTVSVMDYLFFSCAGGLGPHRDRSRLGSAAGRVWTWLDPPRDGGRAGGGGRGWEGVGGGARGSTRRGGAAQVGDLLLEVLDGGEGAVDA